ncbi:hypothetical protein QBC37DRAFT_274361 [Rhypophila decipiens]|uniref:BHLH domain-containing protein n=1 Tax=Rhypophila decipiens TaxID=261697 RepID=A0AAN6YHH4_9PEZI|nr:hypothetical protein QBC37DRAFT_274361 [Rhypophila decipiens]
MPRATLPPTPGSSTDMKGQDGSKLATLQISFELPPPAMISADGSPNSMRAPGPSPYPTQPSETVKSRRRSSTLQGPAKDKGQFALPPPPTRSRKIIQMKPREESPQEARPSTKAAASAPKNNNTSAAAPPAVAGTKRKQPSTTSAAGRKIARKTAHSLIERRRRSKMNEEFAVLKNMIPACTGEMHKLAILQASIEYVRYLEDCVAKLKAQCVEDSGSRATDTSLPSPTRLEPYNPDRNYTHMTDVNSPDVEMTSSDIASPTFTHSAGRSNQPSVSPALLAEDMRDRHNSHSSISTEYRHHNRYSVSANTSPNFGPQAHGYAPSIHSASGSTLPSPALIPQRDLDQEATTALLMLNQADRRHSSTNTSGSVSAGRGMSVRDLLKIVLLHPSTVIHPGLWHVQRQSLNPRLCTFPSFPIGRSRESLQQTLHPTTYSTPRTLPPLPRGPDLEPYNNKRRSTFRPPRLLPVNLSSQSSRAHTLSPSCLPPPLFSSRNSPPTARAVSTTKLQHKRVFSSSKPQPLRLVQETLKDKRKKQPPVFYAQHSHSIVQSLTYITIQQKASPCPVVDDYNIYFNKMASSNPVMPKVGPPPNPVTLPPLPNSNIAGASSNSSGPRPTAPSFGVAAPPSKEELIADLRRQLSDTASDASSVDSRGRRRRRNNNNKALAQKGAVGGLAGPQVLPRLAETKPVRLQLGLNLDVEVELKARLQGDVSLTLL